MIWAAVPSMLLVLYLLWMVELLPVTTWTFEVARYILWSRCFFLTIMQFFKMTFRHTHSQKCSVLVWGAWRCISTSSLASKIARLQYYWTTGRRGVQYSTKDYSELTWVYSKKDTSCVIGKWWPNSILLCMFHSCFHYFCPSPVHAANLYSLGWLDKLCRNVSLSVGVLFNSLPYLCSVMLLDGFVLLTCFHHNHFLLHSTHILMSCLWLSNMMGKILLLSCQRSRHVAVHQ